MFKTWSLRQRLISAFTLSAVFLAGVGSYGVYQLRRSDAVYGKALDESVGGIKNVGDMRSSTNRIVILLAGITGRVVPTDEQQALEKAVSEERGRYEKARDAYLKNEFGPGEESLWKKVVEDKKDLIEFGDKVVESAKGKTPQEVAEKDKLLQAYMGHMAEYRESIKALTEYQVKSADEISAQASADSNRATVLLIAAVVIGFISSVILGLILSKSLSTLLTSVSQRLSSGSDEVASAAQQISSTSEELSSAATEQAASLQETAASVEEMSAMIKKSADNSSHSRELSTGSKDTAQRGKHTVEEMISAINEIDASNRDIAEVVKVIADIGNKTKVINDIVFKTQLLSFNASVEAARAGEHGKGFAVVAEEVGNLAQMSGTAANQISSMLDESLTKVERLISTNRSKVEAGLSVSKRCGDVLDEIVKDIENVNGLSSEIETAMQEQSRGVNEITKAMAQLDQVTQQNASASQQAASAAEQLSGQASVLQSSVVDLEGIIYGGGQRQTVAVAPTKRKGPKAKPPVSPVKKTGNRFATPSSDDPGFGEEAA